jgi:uncharacterized protein YndB with AHSA1/START domain
MIPILLALAFIAILFVIVIAGQPDEFKICRSADISAPPEKIFPHVNDLHQWKPWSPWAKLDPNSTATFSGSESGSGAVMAWAGNNKVGQGKMTITESAPVQRIRLRLEFQKPMVATNLAEFSFTPEADQTVVTWSMSGKNNLMGKIFGLFVNCDQMVGGQFETGLANLKRVAEAAAKS